MANVACDETTGICNGNYYLDSIKISEAEYKKYIAENSKIGTCKPCYQKVYSGKNQLMYEGVFYTDCAAGIYFEYYSSGQRKTSGFHKEIGPRYKGKIYPNHCWIKHGTWTYFNLDGTIQKVEIYENGKLVK